MTERMIDNKFGISPKDEQIKALAKKIWEALSEIDPDPMHPEFESFNDPVKDQVIAYATDMINGFSSLNNNKSTRDLYEYALARLGLPDTPEMRVLFWDERNDLEWDEETDSYIVPPSLPCHAGKADLFALKKAKQPLPLAIWGFSGFTATDDYVADDDSEESRHHRKLHAEFSDKLNRFQAVIMLMSDGQVITGIHDATNDSTVTAGQAADLAIADADKKRHESK